jgi:hypothetical protein
MPTSIDSSAVRPRADARRSAVVIGALLVILLSAVLLAAMLGPYPLAPGEVIAAIGRRVSPHRDAWERWRPDPSWTPPACRRAGTRRRDGAGDSAPSSPAARGRHLDGRCGRGQASMVSLEEFVRSHAILFVPGRPRAETAFPPVPVSAAGREA